MFTVTNPMVRVEPVTSARVSGATLGEPLMTRDTVWWETQARAATSDMTSARVGPAGCTDLLRPGRRPGRVRRVGPGALGAGADLSGWSAGSAGGAGPPLVVDVESDGEQQHQALDHRLHRLVDTLQLH